MRLRTLHASGADGAGRQHSATNQLDVDLAAQPFAGKHFTVPDQAAFAVGIALAENREGAAAAGFARTLGENDLLHLVPRFPLPFREERPRLRRDLEVALAQPVGKVQREIGGYEESLHPQLGGQRGQHLQPGAAEVGFGVHLHVFPRFAQCAAVFERRHQHAFPGTRVEIDEFIRRGKSGGVPDIPGALP
ncbi:hypothetical protein SDC9_172870 [bioreactor metagenome]|uniref:Uncharacterized protein n=1 Tax=bioreactor metagenome TaxID=1076179 RepID=A0A645GEX2_9ZZZZ